jgi:hypothetical protein
MAVVGHDEPQGRGEDTQTPPQLDAGTGSGIIGTGNTGQDTRRGKARQGDGQKTKERPWPTALWSKIPRVLVQVGAGERRSSTCKKGLETSQPSTLQLHLHLLASSFSHFLSHFIFILLLRFHVKSTSRVVLSRLSHLHPMSRPPLPATATSPCYPHLITLCPCYSIRLTTSLRDSNHGRLSRYRPPRYSYAIQKE